MTAPEPRQGLKEQHMADAPFGARHRYCFFRIQEPRGSGWRFPEAMLNAHALFKLSYELYRLVSDAGLHEAKITFSSPKHLNNRPFVFGRIVCLELLVGHEAFFVPTIEAGGQRANHH